MDYPNGYVYRVRRGKVYEVAGRLDISQPLVLILSEILIAKRVILQTLEVIKEKKKANAERLIDVKNYYAQKRKNLGKSCVRTICKSRKNK